MIIVICLIAERFLLEYQHLREFRWLGVYSQWLDRPSLPGWLRQGFPGLLILLLPPVLLVGMLQQLLANSLFGLAGVVFAALVLLYSLGPQDLDSQIDQFAQAVEEDDEPRARAIAAEIISDEPPVSEPAFSQAVAESTLYLANQRLFAVLFWFMLLGPMGAILYRMASRLPHLDQANRDLGFYLNAKQLLSILNWLPARLTALCYAIAGSFEDALYGWHSYSERRFDEFSDSSSGTLICTGSGAMRLNTLLDEAQEGHQDYTHLPQAAMALVWRALVVWLVIATFLSIAGLV